ncbi:MAG: chromosome segregation protein SMC [Bacteroidia bacterium]|nr:chromosome segregation protein SMC [Bacteroidia bacterium]
MQLTSLEIFGFKSFADRQRFVFDAGITGIVGPNGCGKSNIVDSIRWVLGEQRTKNLRSDKMENIIFNGTKSRRKANFAEVSLTFENTRNILPTEYSTVSITRKLYRSGESEYLINGVTCRLKDIQNLFMDTGISADSYAIIELKMVDEILTNKDNERRKFIEEAAGISKYKIRKKQTMSRLSETDADLERVEDLLFEIDKNLKSLEKQARRTQKYFEMKELYKVISSQYAFLASRSIRERQQQLESLTNQGQDELIGVQSAMAQREARLQDLKKELLDNEKLLSSVQYDLNQHLRKIQSVETEKSIKNERLKYLQQRELAISNQMESEQQQLVRTRSVISQLNEDVARAQGELETVSALEQEAREALDEAKARHEQESASAKELSTRHRDVELSLQQLTREKDMKKVQIQSLESELARTREDRQRREGDLDAFSERQQTLEAEVAVMERQLDELKQRREAHREELRDTEEAVTANKDSVYKTNRLIDAKQNEYNLTKSLVENLEGFPASVKFLKKNARWMKDAPLLSDVFAVPETYKVALENFLDPYLSYYVVPGREDAIRSVHMLNDSSKGRANFFVLDELDSYKASTPLLFTQAQHALDVVEFGEPYRKLAAFLLDKVYFVAREEDIPDEIPDDAIFLTHTGGVSRRKFIISGGSLGLFEGKRLGRAVNMEKLGKEIEKLEKQHRTEQTELEKSIKRLEELKRVDLQKQIEPLQQDLSARQRDLSVLQTREKEHNEFMARVGQRSETLEAEIENLSKAIEEADPQIKRDLEELQQIQSQLASQRVIAQEAGDAVEGLSRRFNEAHIRLIHTRNQAENLSRELDQKQETIEKLGSNESRLRAELDEVRRDTDGIINANLQDDDVIVTMYRQKKEMEASVGRMEEKVGMTKNSIHQVEDSMSGERKRREEIMDRQTSLKEQAADIRVEMNSLRERMSVEFQVDITTLSEVALFDNPLDTYDLNALESQMLSIRGKVQTYGEINPMAVEAYSEMKERFDFINDQKRDLVEAKTSLLETIAEIDQTAKEKFLETFIQVRENFQKVFRSLFSEDDSCDMLLLDEENPLESDVSIIARPKGKRPLTIKQLSGGEKTLTAVALLFSLYLIKPAPFCIFDEVDAPLDDANIDKFNNIIRDFSTESQFIIVTHNKRTMAATNVMYGVTMQNVGISRVLPVDMESMPVS